MTPLFDTKDHIDQIIEKNLDNYHQQRKKQVELDSKMRIEKERKVKEF